MQKLKSLLFAIGFVVATFSPTTTPARAALLLVDGTGQLTGANDVDVLGALFDVAFVDGTCAALFTGCDANTDFDFTTQATADAAAQALLDQVFINVAGLFFDTSPGSTNGCGLILVCGALVPWQLVPASGAVVSAEAINWTVGAGIDSVSSLIGSPSFDTALSPTLVFALFSPTSPGPTTPAVKILEPSSLLLFGLGLAGLAGFRRRRRQV